ncbi:MAG: hypothetical protein EOP04_07965 [Proteobacteria bacterium]|nr:MAG: hypothetical protein EOP04_07965 [Pseudomonadota bacterium]
MNHQPPTTLIQKWKAGGKARTTAKLEQLTGLSRKTITNASEGTGDINVFYTQQILKEICSEREVFSFHLEFIPEALPFLEVFMRGKAKYFNVENFSEIECKVYCDAVFGDQRFADYIMRGNKKELEVIERWRNEKFISTDGEFIKTIKEISLTDGPAVTSLLKYCANRFDSKKDGHKGYMFLANCNSATKTRVDAWKIKAENELAQILEGYESGPHKLSAFVFTTNMKD